MEAAPLFTGEIGPGVVAGDADDVDHIIARIVHQGMVPFEVRQRHIVGVPDPQHVIHACFVENPSDVSPQRFIHIGVLACVHGRVPAPVAVHFVVQAKEHGMSEIFQAAGIFTEVVVITPI